MFNSSFDRSLGSNKSFLATLDKLSLKNKFESYIHITGVDIIGMLVIIFSFLQFDLVEHERQNFGVAVPGGKLDNSALAELGILLFVAVQTRQKPVLHVHVFFLGFLTEIRKRNPLFQLFHLFVSVYEKIGKVLAKVRSFNDQRISCYFRLELLVELCVIRFENRPFLVFGMLGSS